MFVKKYNDAGSILILALWTLCLLTTFTVYSGVIVRQKLNLIRSLDSRDNLHFIGQAGINRAILELKRKDPQDRYYALNEGWSNNPTAFEKFKFGTGVFTISYTYHDGRSRQIRYGLLDETAKININTADAKVLMRLLETAAGINEQRALSIAYSIIDWRDANSFFQHPQYGAEDSNYRALSKPYEAKDTPFEVLEELLLVRNMNEEIFERIKDFVTVYGEGKVNINTAPRQVLLALGLSKGLATKILNFRKGDDSLVGTFDDNIFVSLGSVIADMSQADRLSSSDIDELSKFISANVFTTSSSDFTIRCTASLNTGRKQTLTIEAVANRDGFIRRWREFY